MDVATFRHAVRHATEPPSSSPVLAALWHAGRGDWDRAHDLVQHEPDADAAWVHAHLHRQEGDLPNAGYWYRRANRSVPTSSIDDEWADLVGELLAR